MYASEDPSHVNFRIATPFEFIQPTKILIEYDPDVTFTSALLEIEAYCLRPSCKGNYSYFSKTFFLENEEDSIASGVSPLHHILS